MGKFLVKASESGGCHFNLQASNGKTVASSQLYSSVDSCKKGIASVKNNCAAEIEDQTKKNFESLKHPKYEVYKDKGGAFRFRLTAANGQHILASQGYTTKDNCLHGIQSVKNNAPDADIVLAD